ncbi:EcsC family protein [Parasphingorhabdus sp.]|uniref:EcsC family protein n=1 Tax=Parasphingorhabdus sp. TaxID=2709688 RepID=UPI003A9480E6
MDLIQEQNKFRTASPSLLGRGIEAVTSPVTRMASKMVPPEWIEKLVKAIDSATSKPQLARFKHDQSDMEACQQAAKKIENTAKLLNGATGAVSGFGGAVTMTTDIPATIGLATRNIRDTGRAYGYEGEGPAEQLFRLQILEIAALNDKTVRQQRIADLESQITADGSLVDPDPEITDPLVDQAIERISRALALAIPKKKAGSFIPVLGALVSGAVNTSFQGDVSKAARFAFQARRLRASGQ